MKTYFNSRKRGSSSIMVMLIMLVLVIFGVLALMSSYSDFKLAKKNAAWHAKYYYLDAKGQEFISEVNIKLKQVAEKSDDNISYIRLAKTSLSSLSKKYKVSIVDYQKVLIIKSAIVDYDKNELSIILEIKKLQKMRLKDNYKYYAITEWKQMPKSFKYEGQNNIWDGEVTNP